jgi:hypothetical protein
MQAGQEAFIERPLSKAEEEERATDERALPQGSDDRS